MDTPLRIGLTRGEMNPKFLNYVNWLKAAATAVEVVDLAESRDLAADLATLDGIVLTGGCDLHPERYDADDAVGVCDSIDLGRDELEFSLLDLTSERDIPILGICRGLQVLNVFYGGTLIPHLPDVVEGSEVHAKDGLLDRRHALSVTPGSLLFKATRELSGEVNSAHHQAIARVGEGLVASAKGDDGVVEAIERLDPTGKPYLLAVQWHPERMADFDNPFAQGVRDQFLFEAESTRILSRSNSTPAAE